MAEALDERGRMIQGFLLDGWDALFSFTNEERLALPPSCLERIERASRAIGLAGCALTYSPPNSDASGSHGTEGTA